MQQADFSDSFIKGMLGWIRWIASSIANLFQSGSGHSSGDMSMVAWFADNWIKILIGLIVVGVLIDWMVWMARWRPYWVWFRKRRILLDNDVDGIDDDDLMLHYSDMAPARTRRRRDDGPEPDEYDDIRPSDYEPDDYDEDDEEYADGDYEVGVEDEDDDFDGEYEEKTSRRNGDSDDFDALYDDRYGDYGKAHRSGRPAVNEQEEADEPDEPEDETAASGEIDLEAVGHGEETRVGRGRWPSRVPQKRLGLFGRSRKKTSDDEDPFSVEGDFFDDLGEDPMDDIPPARVKLSADHRDAQDTSVYQRPKVLPGDEPGAVRGADEDDGWHSGYTQRSAERGRRRRQDTRE